MAENNISTQQHNLCCGCEACADVCPKNAITYRKDGEGFLYPVVSDDCVECGICRKVCPELNVLKPDFEKKQQYIACLDKDRERRDKGSSGGIFGLLASFLIDKGYVVCGAAFDEHLQLKHHFASDHDGLEKLKKSKYIQSDCSTVYAHTKKDLRSGQKVMFVGTPCQCNALLNVLNCKRDGLVVVDFACHGVPSQELFDKCIRYYEEKHGCKVEGYSFRHKPKRYGSPQNFLLKLKKGDKIYLKEGRYYEEAFYCGFQKYITLRPSCYSCQWAHTQRISDITLADFWGIESVTDKWDRTDHPSLVLINTEKGRILFDSIKEQIDWTEVKRRDAIRGNGSLIGPTSLTPKRALFFADYKTLSFDEVVEKHLACKRRWKKDVYYAIPFSIRKFILKLTKKF
jgi:coenzyme F420-reducing hydrogenase beta subunit